MKGSGKLGCGMRDPFAGVVAVVLRHYHQILEKGKRGDEAEDRWKWDHGICHGERFKGRRQSVQLNEGDSVAVSDGAQDQLLDAVKGVNPANNIWIYECGRIKSEKEEGTCVGSKGAGRIWKGLLPQFDGVHWGIESDASKKVFPSPRDP